MAYIWDRPGDRLALYKADSTGRDPREITRVRAFAGFLWSPTAQAFAVGDDQDPTMPFYTRTRVVRTDGVEWAVPLERVLAFFWSPDGSKLACLTLGGSEGTVGLVVLNVQQGGSRESVRVEFAPSWGVLSLLPFFDQYAISHRIWSPDSRYVVVPGYIAGMHERPSQGDEDMHIYVIDSEGLEPPKAVAQGVLAFWSPV